MVPTTLPALRASRVNTWVTLKETVGSVAGTGGSLVLRKSLVIAQVTLSFLLLLDLLTLLFLTRGVLLLNLADQVRNAIEHRHDDRDRDERRQGAGHQLARVRSEEPTQRRGHNIQGGG